MASSRRFIDTNLIIRHLVQDNPRHARIAEKLFDACDRGQLVLILLPAVLAECVFVLESFYQHPRPAIADALTRLITSPGIDIPSPAVHVDALSRYAATRIHFVDCLLAAIAAADHLPVASLDRDFRKFPDVDIDLD